MKIDSLVTRLDGAIKFAPMLASNPAISEDDALALAQEGHAKYIAALQAELRDDPDARGYKTMTDAQIAAEMNLEIPVTETQEITARDGKTSTVEVVVRVRPAPCWRVISGIKYGRNVVREKEIAEARA